MSTTFWTASKHRSVSKGKEAPSKVEREKRGEGRAGERTGTVTSDTNGRVGRKGPQLNSELVDDMTALRMGKTRLVSKNKNKPSKLKEVILHDKIIENDDDDGIAENSNEVNGSTLPEITVRHYVHQFLSPELDVLVQDMLEDLHRYQERAKENPAKFKKRKRFVTGLREVSRALRLGKLKGVIVAPNMHSSASSGGLDDHVVEIVDEASLGGGSSSLAKNKLLDSDRPAVPVVFALSKNRLGKACGKPVRQCAVGLLSVEGAERKWKQIIEMTERLRRKWLEERLTSASVDVVDTT